MFVQLHLLGFSRTALIVSAMGAILLAALAGGSPVAV